MKTKTILINLIIAMFLGLFTKVMVSFGHIDYNLTSFNLLVLSMLCWLLLNQLGSPEEGEK